MKRLTTFALLITIGSSLQAIKTIREFEQLPGGHVVAANAATKWNHNRTIADEASCENDVRIGFYHQGETVPCYSVVREGEIVEYGQFSNHNNRFVSCWNGTLRVHDIAAKKKLYSIASPQPMQAIWSRDDSKLLITSTNKQAIIRNAQTGEPLLTLIGHSDVVLFGAWSHDDSKVVTTSWDGTARVWDAHSGEQLALLVHDYPEGEYQAASYPGHEVQYLDDDYSYAQSHNCIFHVSFSHDDTMIATVASDGMARIWYPDYVRDSQGICELNRPVRHDSPVYFTPDGVHVMAFGVSKQSGNDVVQIYNLASGDCVLRLATDTDCIAQARWEDAGTIVTEHYDDTTARWHFTL